MGKNHRTVCHPAAPFNLSTGNLHYLHDCIVKRSSEAWVGVDSAGCIIDWNPRAEVLFGWKREDALGRDLAELLFKNDQKKMVEQMMTTLRDLGFKEESSLHSSTLHAVKKDISELQIEIQITSVKREEELLFLVRIVDLSEAERAENLLKKKEYLLQTIIDNTPSAVYARDSSGRYLFVNKHYLNLFQLTWDQVKGKTDFDLFPKEIAETFEKNDLDVIKAGKFFQSEEIAPQPDGNHVYFSVKFPLLDQNNLAYAICGISTDITESKRTQALIAEQETKVIAAENANKLKSAFLANMSHELRTPLHGILSYARFGQQKIETAPLAKIKSFFDEIYESGSRLITLLNDLLDLSKLEAGKVEYSMEKASLSSVVESVISETKAFADEKGIKVKITSLLHKFGSTFDENRMMQVFRNLITNAIKFSHPGTTVKVEMEETEGCLRCRVVNQGVDIPTGELETIFDKFVQSSKTRTGAGGTGLGLAICKEIIRAHQGKIWAETISDGATVFVVEIPKATEA
jgi:PAS domain S-box-containing protein